MDYTDPVRMRVSRTTEFNRRTADHHGPGVGALDTSKKLDKRAFSSPIDTNDAMDLPFIDNKIARLKRNCRRGIYFCKPLGLQKRNSCGDKISMQFKP